MDNEWRLTPRAERRLQDIFLWTFDTFGPRQADLYLELLIGRCHDVANDRAHFRTTDTFPNPPYSEPLRIAKAESHYILFLKLKDETVIFDFLHEKSDLPRKLESLGKLSPD